MNARPLLARVEAVGLVSADLDGLDPNVLVKAWRHLVEAHPAAVLDVLALVEDEADEVAHLGTSYAPAAPAIRRQIDASHTDEGPTFSLVDEDEDDVQTWPTAPRDRVAMAADMGPADLLDALGRAGALDPRDQTHLTAWGVVTAAAPGAARAALLASVVLDEAITADLDRGFQTLAAQTRGDEVQALRDEVRRLRSAWVIAEKRAGRPYPVAVDGPNRVQDDEVDQ